MDYKNIDSMDEKQKVRTGLLTLEQLFSVQTDSNKLKSLYIELANHENFNPYKSNVISDMPKGSGGGRDFCEWYAAEKERIEGEIEYYKKKIQHDRKMVNDYIESAPYPERDIIRYRVINGLGWYDIGDLFGLDRRTVSRKFYDFVKKCP